MRKALSIILVISIILTMTIGVSAENADHEHQLMKMANMNSHYSECTVCFEIFDAGEHIFENGKCIVCGHSSTFAPFEDVPMDAWYYDEVVKAVETGIINGKSATEFKPDDLLTYAEALKLAACMNQLYLKGEVTLSAGDPWYKPYVDYCKENKITSKDYAYDESVTRAGYMEIFANALPDHALKAINNVPDGSIPDVSMNEDYAESVYKLYRAGILTGVDSAHRCEPHSTIKRCEVAAIIARMMDETQRIKFSMESDDKPKTDEENSGLEIPKDAQPAPEIDENESSPKAETPDMYEPFEIEEQPLYVAGAEDGAQLEYTVKVSGGKMPYTYEWVSRGWHNQVTPIEDGEYAKGTKTNTLSLAFSMENPYTSQFCCIVTDSLGQTVQTDYVELPEQTFIFNPDGAVKYGDGYIFTGRVSKGSVKVGDTVAMSLSGEKIRGYGVVSSIEMFKKYLDEAEEGNYCGILIEKFEEYPYDVFISESYGQTMTEYIESLGNYGVKVPLKVTQCYVEPVGDEPHMIFPLVKGGTPPYSYEWYVREGEGEYKKVVNDDKYKIEEESLYIYADEKEHVNDINYLCIITDGAGNERVISNWHLYAYTTPYLSKEPQDAYANPGDTVTFSLRSRGVNVTYQWYVKYDGRTTWQKIEPIDSWASGETTPTLKIQVEKHDLVNHCEYRCEVTQGSYSVVSQSAKINPIDIIITEQPQNVPGQHAHYVQFRVKAEGANGPFTYQWLIRTPDNEIPLVITEGFDWAKGQTTDTLSVAVDEKKLTSDYTFSCIVTDSNGIKRVSEEAYVIVTSDASVSFEKGKNPESEMIVIID